MVFREKYNRNQIPNLLIEYLLYETACKRSFSEPSNLKFDLKTENFASS
jgi:hypothetical protein